MGPIYRSALLYRAAMTVLEGTEGARRRRRIVESIPPGSTVVDLCCGDARIAAALQRRGCEYLGLDINRRFVRSAKRRGIDTRHWDAATMDVPCADVVCMLSSLYHFIPDERAVFDRMVESAGRLVVISEPVDNWATSGSPLLRRLARWLTRVDGRSFPQRHSRESLEALVNPVPADCVELTADGRELVITVDTRRLRDRSGAE